jgi:hypothetical protein
MRENPLASSRNGNVCLDDARPILPGIARGESALSPAAELKEFVPHDMIAMSSISLE